MLLSFFNNITGSYALALLLWALVFKIVFLPFSIKQQKNQIKMAKLAPQIEVIKAKYKGRTDRTTQQKQQQEIMDLQQKEGASPFSGCLPMIFQLVIVIFLYAVIQSPISYITKTSDTLNSYNETKVTDDQDLKQHYQSIIDAKGEIKISDVSVALWNDLSKKEDSSHTDITTMTKGTEITLINKITKYVNSAADEQEKQDRIVLIESYGIDYETIPNFTVFGINLADNPSFKNISVLIIIPFLAAIASWLSMWLTRKLNKNANLSAQDPQAQASTRIMDLTMPLMTLFFAFNFSGMLGLYWIYQSVLGLGQSLIIAKVMPLPEFSEEELKEINRQKKQAEKAQKEAIKNQPKHKSLHYIDDEDYDELPTVKQENKDKKNTSISSDMPQIKD